MSPVLKYLEAAVPKGLRGGCGAAGVLACCVCCFVLLGPFCPKRRAMASLSHGDDGSSAPASLEIILTVFRHSRITTVLAVFFVSTLYSVLMSILGEVRITNLHCLQQFPQDKGFTEVIDVECRLSGNAGGKEHIRASLHVHTATFDDEKWKLITLMCSRMADYHNLFAPSCGSVGDFTDIKQDAEGNLAISFEMQCYSFSVRRLTSEFYARVYPFDTKFFRKVHPAGALVFSGVHSHLMLLQHLLIHLPKAKQPIWVLSEVPKYWLEDDGAMCLDETHR